MAARPTAGQVNWAEPLNAHLDVEHALDGTHRNILAGTGSPEGAVTGTVGQLYRRTDGGTGTSLYIKESGTGNTGWVAVTTAVASAAGGVSSLWVPFDGVCETMPRNIAGGTATAMTSGQSYWFGGGIAPAGSTVTGIVFVSSAAAVTPTHQFFAIGIPDDAASMVAVLGITEDDLTTAWAVNTAKSLSLLEGDGGTGEVSFAVDTPVYLGIVQVAGTPATLRGIAGSSFVGGVGRPYSHGGGPGGVTIPESLALAVTLGISTVSAYGYAKGTIA